MCASTVIQYCTFFYLTFYTILSKRIIHPFQISGIATPCAMALFRMHDLFFVTQYWKTLWANGYTKDAHFYFESACLTISII